MQDIPQDTLNETMENEQSRPHRFVGNRPDGVWWPALFFL